MSTPFYDAPDRLIGMAIDQELTMRGTGALVSEVFTGNPALSPNERVGFVERIRAQAAAYGPAAEALAGIATNPFVWLTFLTEPTIIGKVASRTGRLLVSRPEFVPWIRKYGTMMQSVGMEWTGTMMTGTGASRVMEDVLHWRSRAQEEVSKRIGNQVVLAKAAEKSYAKARGISVTEAQENLDVLETAWLEGWWRKGDARKRTTLAWTKGPDGSYSFMPKEVADNMPEIKWTLEEIEDELKAGGRLDLAKARRDEYNRRAQVMFGKEGKDGTPLHEGPLREQDIDPEKVYRLYGSMVGMEDRVPPNIKNAIGESALARIFKEVADAKPADKAAAIAKAQKELVKFVAVDFANPYYVPRNTGFVFRKTTAKDLVKASFNDPLSVLPFPGSALQRTAATRVYTDETAQQIGRAFNDPELGRRLQSNSFKRFDNLKNGSVVRVDVLNPEVAFERYMSGTGTAYSLYGRPASKEAIGSVENAVREAMDAMNHPKIRGDRERFMQQLITPTARQHRNEFGGMTNADLLDEVIQRIPESNPVRSQMQDVIIPRLTGSVPKERMFATSFMNTLRSTVSGFNKTIPAMAAMEEAGPVGKQLAKFFDDFGNDNFQVGQRDPMRSIADYFYVTHIGANLGSVMANMTQPLVTLTRLNADPITMMRAYGSSIKGMVRYADEFAKAMKANKNRITPSTHDDIKRRAFGDTMFEMAELGGTGRAMYVDEVSQEVASMAGASNHLQRVFNVMMGPFQTAEMMNRVVAAKWGQATLGITDDMLRANPRAQHEISRLVRETQFGASVLNTPTTFMNPASLFSNPLIRQFLQFPVRMALSPFVIDARHAWPEDVPHSPVGKMSQYLTGGPAINNMARAVGFSALGYELIKGLFDVNASRYGFVESSLAIPGNFIDDQDGPLPIPPVLSVTSDMAQLLVTGDRQLAAQTLPRLFPGGIGIARALNVGPDVNQVLPNWAQNVIPQRTYVDYQTPNEDGTVNVYNWKGQLMYRMDPLELALQGLGLDPQGFQDQAAPTRIAQAAVEGERAYRQSVLQAEAANNFQRSQKLREEFQKRYGYDLPVQPRHRDSFDRNRLMTREEVVLRNVSDTVEPDLFRQSQELEALLATPQ